MKKMVLLGTILCLSFVGFAGCGNGQNSVNPTGNPLTVLGQTEQGEQLAPMLGNGNDIKMEVKGNTLDEAIVEAVHTSQHSFLEGEFFSSAYHILQIDEDVTETTVFLLVTHGWYNRDTGLEKISGSGIDYGVLVLTRNNGFYTVLEYNEYGYKQLYPLGSIFPVHLVEYVHANLDKYADILREEKQIKVIEHFATSGQDEQPIAYTPTDEPTATSEQCAPLAFDEEIDSSMSITTLSFRAEVLEFDFDYSLRNEESILFVHSTTTVGNHSTGGRYFIRQNESLAVLNAQGENISYSDILPGSIVDITYHGLVLQSDPAIIPAAITIQIVEQ